jgi:hypothetical protein
LVCWRYNGLDKNRKMERLVFIYIWVGFAVVTALAAATRDRSAVGWFFIGLLGGIFALIAVLVMRLGERVEATATSQPNWTPGQGSKPKGPVIAVHKGELIHEDGEYFWTQGRTFRTLEAAREQIDNPNL